MARTKPQLAGGKINRVVIGRKWVTITIRLNSQQLLKHLKRLVQ
jgi:hypothetical protein